MQALISCFCKGGGLQKKIAGFAGLFGAQKNKKTRGKK